MSEMGAEAPPEGGGSFLTRRVAGMPAWVLIVVVAGGAYLLFFRNKGTNATSSGGGGTSTTGNIDFTPGTTTVNITGGAASAGGSSNGTPNPQPKPKPPPKKVKTGVTMRTYTVKSGDTLASIARKFGISVAALAHANVYVPGEVPGDKKAGQTLGTGAGLKTGQVLKIPGT